MLAHPLTKAMTGEKLIEALRMNKWDLSQPIERLAKKRSKQAQRSAAKKEENLKKGVKAGVVDVRYGYKPEGIIADDFDSPPSGWILQDMSLDPKLHGTRGSRDMRRGRLTVVSHDVTLQ